MNKTQRSSLAIGVILVLVGLYFILANVVPQFQQWLNLDYSWPVIILIVAAGLLLLGLVVGAPDMAVPACIVGGIGGILYYQNMTNNWGSWAYMWALIPGFAGIGMLLAHVLGARDRYSLRSALDSIGTSLVMFIIFGAFFGAFRALGDYWPLLLIAAGLLIGIRTFLRPRN